MYHNTMIKQCEQCSESFDTKDKRKKFCSRSCSGTFNNLKRGNRAIRGLCLSCNKEMMPHQKKYCSHACQWKYQEALHISDWLEGKSSGSHANGVLTKIVRRYLLEQANNACTKCGWKEINPTLGYPVLTIDHIDGNWRNNSVDNLVVLCYNCHTLTPTFGALNIGNGAGVRGTYDRTSMG